MTTEQIQADIIAAKERITELDALTSTSKVAIWRLWVYVFSFVAKTVTKSIPDLYLSEVQNLLKNQLLASEEYYRVVVLGYRHGHTFNRETLQYEGDYTDEQIEVSKIVKRASSDVIIRSGRRILYIKVAQEINGKLAKIPENTLASIQEFVFVNSAAGTNIEYFSDNADQLKLEIDVYYDPLLLDENGEYLDASEPAPIPTAINNFLASENFAFNGELRISELTDALQNLRGVKDRSVKVKSAYYNIETPANWHLIDERYIAAAGYFEIAPENLTVNYIPKYVV